VIFSFVRESVCLEAGASFHFSQLTGDPSVITIIPMIKNTLILLVAVFLASCSQKSAENKTATDNPSDTKAKAAIVFDVRSAEEFQGGHLEDSINIPHTAISEKIADHVKNKDAEIVLYCGSGKRAGIAQKSLTDMGYTDVTNAGGYKDLKKK